MPMAAVAKVAVVVAAVTEVVAEAAAARAAVATTGAAMRRHAALRLLPVHPPAKGKASNRHGPRALALKASTAAAPRHG